MGLRINQNIAAFNSYRNLTVSDSQLSKSLEKLSSGFRINRAADDAAGLVISEGLRSQVGGLKVAVRNAQDGISVVQTAEGALTEVHSILQRMRDLALHASNTGGADSTAVQADQDEISQLRTEVDRIANTTKYGSKVLLDGTYSTTGLAFQVGSGTSSNERISVTITSVKVTDLGCTGSLASLNAIDVTTSATTARDAVDAVDAAISAVSTARGQLGAVQNRFEHTIANLGVAQENLSASESRIRDTDMALEMVSFTRHQILMQAGTAMLAQANAAPQSVLSLLRG
jgi:flagellin